MDLLVGTALLRPYVFAFLALFIAAGVLDLGWRRTLGFTAGVWPVALVAEFSSTRTGFPFGLYEYTGLTRGRELFLAVVLFVDLEFFAFIAYVTYCIACMVIEGGGAPRWLLAIMAGVVMTDL